VITKAQIKRKYLGHRLTNRFGDIANTSSYNNYIQVGNQHISFGEQELSLPRSDWWKEQMANLLLNLINEVADRKVVK